MGAISYPGRTFPGSTAKVSPVTTTLPLSDPTRHSLPNSFRWPVVAVGFVAVLLFMFIVELAVYQLVDAGSRVADKLYRRAIIAYQEFEQPSLAEQPGQQADPSATNELLGSSDRLAKDKMALRCIQNPHGCN